MDQSKWKYILFIFIVTLIFAFLYRFSFHEFLIYPDSYEYLLASKSFVENNHIDLYAGGGAYLAPIFYLSRIGYSVLLGIFDKLLSSDLANIATSLNLIFFVFNSALLLWYGLKTYPTKPKIVILLWSAFVLSYTNIFWLHLVVSDYFAQTALLLAVLYSLSKSKRIYLIEYFLFILLLFTRAETIIPFLIMLKVNNKLDKYSYFILLTSLVTYFLSFLGFISNLSVYWEYNFKRATDTINISIPLLAAFGLITGGIFYSVRKKVSLIHIFYLSFIALGFVFNNVHNFKATLLNLQFQFLHELINLFIAAIIFILIRRIKIVNTNGKHLLYLFFSSLFVYHFYFQHTTIFLPLLYLAGINILTMPQAASFLSIKKRSLDSLGMAALICIIYLHSLSSFIDYSVKSVDVYKSVLPNKAIDECFNNDKEVKVSSLLPTLYYRYEYKYKISNLELSDLQKNYNIIIDAEYVVRNNLDVKSLNLNSVGSPSSLLIKNIKAYTPVIYYRCD